ncbi:MAG: DUF5668 domain-containing protein [Bryobacteraceae bacterium]
MPAYTYTNPAEPSVSAAPNPYFQSAAPPLNAPVQTSPGLAFALGCIPGVGAIYNGQYLKGFVHVVIFGLIISLLNSGESGAGEPFLGIMLAAFVCYMPFEAYHTAKKRQIGVRSDEWSSLMSQSRYAGRAPIGPIFLILIGVLFLLDSLHLIEFRQVGRFWPVILIVVGAYMLYSRVTSPDPIPPVAGSPGIPPNRARTSDEMMGDRS